MCVVNKSNKKGRKTSLRIQINVIFSFISFAEREILFSFPFCSANFLSVQFSLSARERESASFYQSRKFFRPTRKKPLSGKFTSIQEAESIQPNTHTHTHTHTLFLAALSSNKLTFRGI